MKQRCISDRRDELYPDGFGLIVRPAGKIRTATELLARLEMESDQLRRHGAVLLERSRVHDDVAAEIRASDAFHMAAAGFAPQLLHTHGGPNDLIAPDANPAQTVFSSRATQRVQIQKFTQTYQGYCMMAISMALAPLGRDAADRKPGGKPTMDSVLARLLPNTRLNAMERMTDGELDTMTNDLNTEENRTHGWNGVVKEVTAGAKQSQEAVAPDLIGVDWQQFFVCRFRALLPHARDVRTIPVRDVRMYATRKP